MQKWTLTFPDGLVLEGFRWSVIGYYYKDFPDSGLNSLGRCNRLAYSHQGIEDAGIKMEKE